MVSVPNVSVVMLGASGAGKTVYLASLYSRLSVAGSSDKDCFYIESMSGDNNTLTALNARLVTPNLEEWPQGTRAMKKWKFRCYVERHHSKHAACDFTYVDYAGGTFADILAKSDSNEQEELDKLINEADVLFGLIDGEKLLKFMEEDSTQEARNDRDVAEFLNLDLPRILGEMQQCKPSAPIHFVISKWDCIQGLTKFSLKEIRSKMINDIPEFRSLIKNRGSKGTIRLIPVSAVGEGFVRFERLSNGKVRMLKTGKKRLAPFQVEVPLAYVLKDVFESAVKELDGQIRELTGIKKLIFIVKSIFFSPLENILPYGLSWVTKKTIDIMLQKQSSERTTLIDKITDERDALLHLIDCFKLITQRFEDENPGSLLS